MYTNIWSKYLPVIRIVLKRAVSGPQTLALNAQDFERAGMARKSGYKFSFRLKNGKLKNVIVDIPLASSLSSLLLQDKTVQEVTQEREFEIQLSPKYELTILPIESEVNS